MPIAVCIVWALHHAPRLLLPLLPLEAALFVVLNGKLEIVVGTDWTGVVHQVHIVQRMRRRHIDA